MIRKLKCGQIDSNINRMEIPLRGSFIRILNQLEEFN